MYSAFPHLVMVLGEFVIYSLYYVEELSSYTWFVQDIFFYHEEALNFSKRFFCWDMIFTLHSVGVIHILIDSCVSNQFCILGMKPTWSWWVIFLIFCWVWFASILLRIFFYMRILYKEIHNIKTFFILFKYNYKV
jgi:hypothetical protein